MKTIEENRLDKRIELLREKLNRQKNIRTKAAYRLSLELDQLIYEAMKERYPVKTGSSTQ
ncbi:MAG: Spo0E family sporulation regulatory protein-aspartic acid phosphatase [Firmicutes bacterium]|nr:Spo0E family sporulation regulatory protein-aspartic acid phosphatase [Bacillota bacterium]